MFIIPEDETDLNRKQSQILLALYEKIGEQKFDIVISRDTNRLIEQEALCNGIPIGIRSG